MSEVSNMRFRILALEWLYFIFKWSHSLALFLQVVLDLLDCVLASMELFFVLAVVPEAQR